MASVSVIPRLIIFSCLLIFNSLSSCSADETEKVPLALYYETLCPGCQQFIVKDLAKVFLEESNKDLANIIDLRLVPYGNAHNISGRIICQHGPEECSLNMLQACVIHELPNVNEHISVISCMEKIISKGSNDVLPCLEKVEKGPILSCNSSSLGEKLHLQYGKETNNLKPPHEYVPWVLVDQQPLRQDLENYISYVCKAYKGTAVPKVCRESQLHVTPKAKGNEVHQVCYPKDRTSQSPQRRGLGNLKPQVIPWSHQAPPKKEPTEIPQVDPLKGVYTKMGN